jgi:hypothetical protein
MSNRLLIDCEVYTNFFMLGLKDYYTGDTFYFEISEWRDDRVELDKWLKSYKGFVIGFNTIHYDNMVLAFIKRNLYKWRQDSIEYTIEYINSEIKRFSDKVIDSEIYYEEIKPYRYEFNKQWTDVDLFLYWSKMLRLSKKISLKGLGIQLGYPVVMELPYNPSRVLTEEESEEIKEYNLVHDLGILKLLCDAKKEEILLRAFINQEYKLNAWSWDAPKIASEVLLDTYCKKTGNDKKEVRNSRYSKKDFKIGDYIPKIDFKTDLLKDLYREISDSYNTFSKEFVYKTGKEEYIKISVGTGGIHSLLENKKYKSDSHNIIYTSDIASLYPTNLLNYKFIRPELSLVLAQYGEIRQLRLKAKKNKEKVKDTFFKLILNSFSGLLDNEHMWFYSPEYVNALRITGQLQLLRTLEELTLNDFQVISMNTDGLEVYVEKDKEDLYLEIMKGIEKEFNFIWEHDKYEFIYYQNINSYIAKTFDGKVKTKGQFVTKPELSNSIDFLVIPKCLELYFVKGIRPEQVLKEPEKYGLHIYDMCASFKVSKDYQVLWNNQKQQRLNRFYVSKNAPFLYKQKSSKSKPDNMLKGWGVQIYNNHEEKPFKDYNIDNRFYLSKINSIISELESNNQIQMF